MAMTAEARNRIRSQVFSGKKFKKKEIDLFGEKVEIRQPTVGMVLAAQQEQDRRKALVQMLVRYCYVPGTNERVFEETDFDAIMELPVGEWFTTLNNAIIELSDIDVGSAEKN